VAGIGFSLRAFAGRPGYAGTLRLYGAAALVSSGSWLLSITGLLLVGLIGRHFAADAHAVERFQVCVTWLLASSLVLSGPLQLQLTRFVSDQMYLKRPERIVPNLFGALVAMSFVSAFVAALAAPWFSGEAIAFRVLLGLCFLTLSSVWIVSTILTGLRRHWPVLWCFGTGYGVMLGCAPFVARFGEVGLLGAFLSGQAVLLLLGLRAITNELGCTLPFEWGCLHPRALRGDLMLVGLLYNLGIWADKLVFWFNPATSRPVAGFFRASDVYDLPVFLAYLTIVPGMAVFLVRIETDFAERNAAFYDAIRGGASLARITQLLDAMVEAVQRALADIGRTQLGALLVCLWIGPALLSAFGISSLHLPLFYVDVLGVLLQVLLLASISIFFYLDRWRLVARLTLVFLIVNAGATWLSYRLGPLYYGWGFVCAAAITLALSLGALNRTLRFLVRDTFLLQQVST
jgi:uncharacterized membrane protein